MTTSKRASKPARLRSGATLEGAVLRALAGAQDVSLRRTGELAKSARVLREQLIKSGLLHVETVRVRPQGTDRQLRVEYAVDPEDRHSVLLRVSLTSDVPLAAPPTMLTTQQAADALNVSRPYVTRLVDDGKVHGVEHTQSGHRRIPVTEVERIQAEMRATRRKALESIDAATQDLRQRELSTAKTKSKRRWVAKQA